jgi:hypothetical protein
VFEREKLEANKTIELIKNNHQKELLNHQENFQNEKSNLTSE